MRSLASAVARAHTITFISDAWPSDQRDPAHSDSLRLRLDPRRHGARSELGELEAAVLVPRAPLGAEPPEHVGPVEARGGEARVAAPRAPVGAEPAEHVEAPHARGARAGRRVPRTASLPGPLEHVQVTVHGRPGADALVPRAAMLTEPHQSAEVSAARRVRTRARVPREGAVAEPGEYVHVARDGGEVARELLHGHPGAVGPLEDVKPPALDGCRGCARVHRRALHPEPLEHVQMAPAGRGLAHSRIKELARAAHAAGEPGEGLEPAVARGRLRRAR
mmetsp:Transcript_1950/g.6448  ORF Transcript_1950/g.6448 Transcript_1950/m.6448 type:complete len:278 (-) Transcript_1950:202-1035(-)